MALFWDGQGWALWREVPHDFLWEPGGLEGRVRTRSSPAEQAVQATLLDAGWVAQGVRLSRKLPSPEDAQSPHPYRLAKAHVFTAHLSQPNFPAHWLCGLFTGHCLPSGPQFPNVALGDSEGYRRDFRNSSDQHLLRICPGHGCACVWHLTPHTPQGESAFYPVP